MGRDDGWRPTAGLHESAPPMQNAVEGSSGCVPADWLRSRPVGQSAGGGRRCTCATLLRRCMHDFEFEPYISVPRKQPSECALMRLQMCGMQSAADSGFVLEANQDQDQALPSVTPYTVIAGIGAGRLGLSSAPEPVTLTRGRRLRGGQRSPRKFPAQGGRGRCRPASAGRARWGWGRVDCSHAQPRAGKGGAGGQRGRRGLERFEIVGEAGAGGEAGEGWDVCVCVGVVLCEPVGPRSVL